MSNEEKALKFDTICRYVLQWANERNLLELENTPKQALKVVEELGEFVRAHLKGKELETQKEFGDVIVTVVVLCGQAWSCHNDTLDFKTYYSDCLDTPIGRIKRDSKNTFGGLSKGIGEILISENGRREKQNGVILLLESVLCFARLNNLDALHCLELAYNNIKDRQGKTENGVFIKQSDLENETQAYQIAFEYAHEIGLLPNIEKGGSENE